MRPPARRLVRGRRRLAVVASAALLTLAGVGTLSGTWGAFTAITVNGGNSFAAADSFGAPVGGNLRMASGSYTGNGTDNRAIDDPGFQPDVVIIKANGSVVSVMRTSTMTGDATKPLVRPLFGTAALGANLIQSLAASGFTLGTDSRVNASGTTYYWVAFKAGTGDLKVGSYTGNGTSQSITGAGFSPEYVAVLAASDQQALQRFTGMSSTFQFNADTGAADRITSLDADGFSVGANAGVNANTTTYHYVAFNEVAGTTDVGSYVGDGVSGRNVTGVGFVPDYMVVRANDTATARRASHRPAAVTGTSSMVFDAASNLTTAIRALQADGFQLGTDASVNASGPTYHYLAFKNTGGGCSQPGTRTLITSGDSWIDQGAPSANNGADSKLKVNSKSPNLNVRALLQFNLPGLPADCTLTSATLRLMNVSPIAGRTIEVYANDAAWTQTGVTWSNQPTHSGTPATAAVSGAGWMQWTVTSQVQGMYSGSNHGFKVKDASENGPGAEQQFESGEAGASWPELIVTFG
jgi:hypothetical protein